MRDQNACATGASVARRTGWATAHLSECASTAALGNERTLGQTYRQCTVGLFARITNDRDRDLRSYPRDTQKAFGRAINPHLFRDAAATTLAIADRAHVRVAAPLLGHRTFTTTERFYQQAKSFDAHRAYVNAIFSEGERS